MEKENNQFLVHMGMDENLIVVMEFGIEILWWSN